MAKLSDLIDHHLSYYKENEKSDFDRARSYYRGDFLDASVTGGGQLNHKLAKMYAQKNLVFAIADTATSSLLGPNPRVAAMPRNPQSSAFTGATTGLMSWAFDNINMRRRTGLSLMDAVLCKRGIFKTSWDSRRDCPVVGNPNPATVFFDLTARDPDDIRYWIQACPLTPTAFARKVKSGRYTLSKGGDEIKPETTPAWMLDNIQKNSLKRFSELDRRVMVYEFYDCESGTVVHFHKETNTILFKGKLDYVPFSMYSLNHSGIDCTGISEVQLILDQQTNINQLLTLWKRIVYMQVPKILYDAGKIDSSTLDTAMDAIVGSLVPVDAEGVDEMRNFGALFYEMPMPDVPNSIIQFIQRLENDAGFVSALAEAARGQSTGAKTATEMTIINAQSRNRLATREGHLNAAVEDVGNKMFYLMQRYMKRAKMVRIAGNEMFTHLPLQTLRQLSMDFEMVAYNPIRKNPAVLLETLQAMVPLLAQAPNIDIYRLFEELVKGLGLPPDIVIPEEKARAAQAQAAQAAAAAEQQKSLGGAAVKETKTDSEAEAVMQGEAANMPPEVKAQVQKLAGRQGQSPPQ